MSDIDNLNYKKQRYKNLLSNVIDIKNELKTTVELLNKPANKVVNGYSINGDSGDGNYLLGIVDETKEIYVNLVNNIIPAIKNKIEYINNDIDRAIAEEE